MSQKVIKIGKSAGVTLSKDVLKKMGVEPGDQVEVTESDGSVLISPVAQDTERREKIARLTHGFIERYRDDLEELAK